MSRIQIQKTLVVICTDYTGSCKSNYMYHMTTTTTVPHLIIIGSQMTIQIKINNKTNNHRFSLVYYLLMLVEFLSIILNFKYSSHDWKQLPLVMDKLYDVKLFLVWYMQQSISQHNW